VIVVTLYLSLNLAYLWVLTPAQIAASPALAADVARTVAGDLGARFVATLIVISSLGFLAVIILTGARLSYAMAADGLFLKPAGRLHPRYRTPVFALWFQAAISIALLATNTYDQLLSYVVFADWLFFGLTAASLFVLRRRHFDSAAVARTPGHPVTTALFVAVAIGIVINSFIAYSVQSLVGSAILIVASIVYFVFLRKK
jgi:APA family basic amino acid/polyamine antiporter